MTEGSSFEATRIVQRSSADSGFDWPRLSFALQIGGIWMLGTYLLGLVTSGGGVTILAILVWMLTCLNFLAGGVGRLVTAELESGISAPRSEGWRFVRSHLLGLLAAPWAVGALTVLGIGAYVLMVRLLAAIPGIGPLLAALLILPTFLFVLAAAGVLMTAYLVPTIMGVENCGPVDAMGHLVRSVRKNPIQMMSETGEVMRNLVPMAAFSGIATLIALVFTYIICVGLPAFDAVPLKTGLVGALESASILGIGFAWIAFMSVFVASSYAVVYYNVSGKAEPGPSEESPQ